MDRQSVKSSAIRSVGYDPESRTMEVEFSSGKVYSHAGVSPDEHEAFINAESLGKHYGQNIRNKFKASEVTKSR